MSDTHEEVTVRHCDRERGDGTDWIIAAGGWEMHELAFVMCGNCEKVKRMQGTVTERGDNTIYNVGNGDFLAYTCVCGEGTDITYPRRVFISFEDLDLPPSIKLLRTSMNTGDQNFTWPEDLVSTLRDPQSAGTFYGCASGMAEGLRLPFMPSAVPADDADGDISIVLNQGLIPSLPQFQFRYTPGSEARDLCTNRCTDDMCDEVWGLADLSIPTKWFLLEKLREWFRNTNAGQQGCREVYLNFSVSLPRRTLDLAYEVTEKVLRDTIEAQREESEGVERRYLEFRDEQAERITERDNALTQLREELNAARNEMPVPEGEQAERIAEQAERITEFERSNQAMTVQLEEARGRERTLRIQVAALEDSGVTASMMDSISEQIECKADEIRGEMEELQDLLNEADGMRDSYQEADDPEERQNEFYRMDSLIDNISTDDSGMRY